MNRKQYYGLFVLSIFMMFVSAFLIQITYKILNDDGWVYVIAIMGWMFVRSVESIVFSLQRLIEGVPEDGS